MSNREEVSTFYDNRVADQVRIGINLRHRTIFRLLKKNGLNRYQRVLEIGCGVGPVTSLILKLVRDGFVHAVDISPKSIEQAKVNLSSRTNLSLSVSDMSDFSAPEKFHVIVLPDVLEHIPI